MDKIKGLYTDKTFLFIETFLLIVLPTLLIEIFPWIFVYRSLIMFCSLIYVVFVIKLLNINRIDTGLTNNNLKKALYATGLSTFLMLVLMFIAKYITPKSLVVEAFSDLFSANIPAPKLLFAFLYNVLSVPVQEYIFRGYFISRSEYVSTNKVFLVIWSAFVFSFVHLQFDNAFLLIGTLLMGILYAMNFLKYRNLYVLILSHAILGTVFVYLI